MSDPTLTDEELAERAIDHTPRPWGTTTTNPKRTQVCRTCLLTYPCLSARLIAALRASREEVERLTATIERIDGRPFYAPDAQVLIDSQAAEISRLGEEVARLTLEISLRDEAQYDLEA